MNLVDVGDEVMSKNDGETWRRKHILIHKIQETLHLSDKTSANLLGVCEDSLQEIFDSVRRHVNK